MKKSRITDSSITIVPTNHKFVRHHISQSACTLDNLGIPKTHPAEDHRTALAL
jgi:hypothetical protein